MIDPRFILSQDLPIFRNRLKSFDHKYNKTNQPSYFSQLNCSFTIAPRISFNTLISKNDTKKKITKFTIQEDDNKKTNEKMVHIGLVSDEDMGYVFLYRDFQRKFKELLIINNS